MSIQQPQNTINEQPQECGPGSSEGTIPGIPQRALRVKVVEFDEEDSVYICEEVTTKRLYNICLMSMVNIGDILTIHHMDPYMYLCLAFEVE